MADISKDKPLPTEAISTELLNYGIHLNNVPLTDEDATIADEQIKIVGAAVILAVGNRDMSQEDHDKIASQANRGLTILSEMVNKYSGD